MTRFHQGPVIQNIAAAFHDNVADTLDAMDTVLVIPFLQPDIKSVCVNVIQADNAGIITVLADNFCHQYRIDKCVVKDDLLPVRIHLKQPDFQAGTGRM